MCPRRSVEVACQPRGSMFDKTDWHGICASEQGQQWPVAAVPRWRGEARKRVPVLLGGRVPVAPCFPGLEVPRGELRRRRLFFGSASFVSRARTASFASGVCRLAQPALEDLCDSTGGKGRNAQRGADLAGRTQATTYHLDSGSAATEHGNSQAKGSQSAPDTPTALHDAGIVNDVIVAS